jgi:hypothetical protein
MATQDRCAIGRVRYCFNPPHLWGGGMPLLYRIRTAACQALTRRNAHTQGNHRCISRVTACRKYGIETVLEKTRLYRQQQDALAKATGGRAGTGTRFVITVENFLRRLHEINAPKERECGRERAVQIVARLLEAHFGVNPSEAEAFLTELEPSVVQEFASDRDHKRALEQCPDYDTARRYMKRISEMRRNGGLVAVNAAEPEPPPEPVSNAAPAPVQLRPETLAMPSCASCNGTGSYAPKTPTPRAPCWSASREVRPVTIGIRAERRQSRYGTRNPHAPALLMAIAL